ncbi:diguanylate cyclase [Vibrio fluvialis]
MNTLFLSDRLITILTDHIEHSLNAIAVLDSFDNFIFCNNAFIRLFELDEQSISSLTFDQFKFKVSEHLVASSVSKKKVRILLRHFDKGFRKKPFRSYELEWCDNRWLLITEQQSVAGEIVLVANDITKIKEMEYKLKNAQKILKHQALTDELTGIPNRRQFMSNLEKEYNRAIRTGSKTCLAIIDIDFFKSINDQFGHQIGDYVLKHFSTFLTKNLRKQDTIGRLGGEEFGILLPETNHYEAYEILNRLLDNMQSEPLDIVDKHFKYSFSAGLVELKLVQNFSINTWISVVDKALYRAKSSGRGQVCLG